MGDIDIDSNITEQPARDLDTYNHHLITTVEFTFKNASRGLAFLDMLNRKLFNALSDKKIRQLDYETKFITSANHNTVIQWNIRKTLKSITMLKTFMQTCGITIPWLSQHCEKFTFTIPSTNKDDASQLIGNDFPHLTGFIIPNDANADCIDWVPALLHSPDVDTTDKLALLGSASSSTAFLTSIDGDSDDDDDATDNNDDASLLTTSDVTENDVDCITGSASFAFSPSRTAPSMFVVHGKRGDEDTCSCTYDSGSDEDIRQTLLSQASGMESVVYPPRNMVCCPSLANCDRPILESMLCNWVSVHGDSNILRSSDSALLTASSSWLTHEDDTTSSSISTIDATVGGNPSISTSGSDLKTPSNQTSKSVAGDVAVEEKDSDYYRQWYKETFFPKSTKSQTTDKTLHRRLEQEFEDIYILYHRYQPMIEATPQNKRRKLLHLLRKILIQKSLRTVTICRQGTTSANKAAKLLWLETPEFPKVTGSLQDDLTETSIPKFVNAFPIMKMSKSVVAKGHHQDVIIDTQLTLSDGSTRNFLKSFNVVKPLKVKAHKAGMKRNHQDDTHDITSSPSTTTTCNDAKKIRKD
eukprot:Seg3562.3 transcript_id=Seg3562.3/GoldUCD/mRNA.D3Y31 product="hypothetical protein" protein_id=Seg3562.3/GoldUCD/D3Y31